nr:odorant binding protein 37 [Monochamus saltuarius]
MKVFATGAVVVVVLVACCIGQTYTEEERERIRKNRDDCITETKVDPNLITRADAGDFVDDDKLKCFTKCFYQKAGFVTENGELLLDVIKAKIPASVDKERAVKVVEDCKQTGKDACETVYLIHKCYFEYTQRNNLNKTPEKAEEAEKEAQSETQTEAQKETATESKA